MRKVGLISITEKYDALKNRMSAQSIGNSDTDTDARLRYGVTLRPIDGGHSLDAWCQIDFDDVGEWSISHHEKRILSAETTSSVESQARDRSDAVHRETLCVLLEGEEEEEEENYTYTKPPKKLIP